MGMCESMVARADLRYQGAMNSTTPIVFAWVGDLHLEEPQRPNHKAAEHVVAEIDAVLRPDFVQFAGDNVQHARDVEWTMFQELTGKLHVPWHALVGDHDAHHDGGCHAFRAHVGDTHHAFSLKGTRFVLLNTNEFRPMGLSGGQALWFRYEVDAALDRGERVVVFQHHYPFKVNETYDGPGVAAWREIVQTRPIAGVFCGHTHYGQIANDGRNVYVATRSIGDPEGGAAGYAVVHLQGDDLAITRRTVDDRGPIVLITHPRNHVLCTVPRHIVSGPDECRVRAWSAEPVTAARFRLDGGAWSPLEPAGNLEWRSGIPGDRLAKGIHALDVEVSDAKKATGSDRITFQVDRSGRFTSVPRAEPSVAETKYC
jgi:Icc protein